MNTLCRRKDSRYSEKDAAKIVRQMLRVAARCHLNGVVHRDMKPEVLIAVPKKSTKMMLLWFVTAAQGLSVCLPLCVCRISCSSLPRRIRL